jgi:nicotinamide-nucleotide amidase
MQATILTIGDEILIGQITDTNSGYIAKSLEKIGIKVHEMLSISDEDIHIFNTLKRLQNQVDLVIITGGLGPTKDDVTKATFCTYFEDKLIRNLEIEKHVDHLFRSFLKKTPSQVNLDQALVPSQAVILKNGVGTAQGLWMQKENTVFVAMPGVPYEMKNIVDNELITRLKTHFKRPFIQHKTLLTIGKGESEIAEIVHDLEDNLPLNFKLAYLPNPGRVRLRLTAKSEDENLLNQVMDNQIKLFKDRLTDCFIGMEETGKVEEHLQMMFLEKGFTLATAESCTGGAIAARLTAIAGSSGYFKGSMVTYNTQMKKDFLGVKQETLNENSVVSIAVAQEMALGVQKALKSDYAISTTGHAGPSKSESEKSLGTVCIAIATPNGVVGYEFIFGQPREKVIERTVNKAFELLFEDLKKK